MSAPHHLPLVDWQKRRRATVLALTLLGVALFAASYFFPWWEFRLYAPQYPKGLQLIISLTGVGGDVQEVNTINHYIGMGHLDAAATFERTYAAWLVGGLALGVFAMMDVAGRKLGWLAELAAVGFPVGFVADTMYWLYHFGHDLDPKAPIHLKPFTPTLFGQGKVGQFRTIATPELGFWLAMAGVVVVGVAVWQRARVCRACPIHDRCHAVCPNPGGLVGSLFRRTPA